MPITSHCMLENISGLQFLKCATDTDTEQKSDCEGDACTQLESATYKISDTHVDFSPSAFTALVAFIILEFPADEQPAAVLTVPLEISSSWQFFFRTALPPRAPSFVS